MGSAFAATVVYWQQEIQHDHEGKDSEKLKRPYYFWISLSGSLPRTIHRVLQALADLLTKIVQHDTEPPHAKGGSTGRYQTMRRRSVFWK
jgi:hypothetical protein